MTEDWNVSVSKEAQRDIDDIFEYIANDLMEPENASRQVKRIWDMIRSLSHIPYRHLLYAHEPWRRMGWRVVLVNHCMIFYVPKADDRVVIIENVIYSGRNAPKRLREKRRK